LDNDDADTSCHNDEDSSNTHSDMNADDDDSSNSSKEGGSSNQNEIIPNNTPSDEDSRADILADGDHGHSTPRLLTPINNSQHAGVSSSSASA